MSDSDSADRPTSRGDESLSAGAMLRAARESRGLHIAALATSIKISPRKLDALEGDRLDELPDATFARALAQTVCRALKIDPQPVLARMPSVESAVSTLEPQRAGLNAPFEEGSGRSGASIRRSQKVLMVAGVLLVVSAAALLLLPPGALRREEAAVSSQTITAVPGPAPAASLAVPGAAPSMAPASAPAGAASVPNASASAVAQGAAVETVHSAPSGAAAAPEAVPMLMLAVSEPSWVEVQDRAARILLSRTLVPGESVRASGETPLRVRIGNAAATQLEFRGRAVDLKAAARNNVVAELELK